MQSRRVVWFLAGAAAGLWAARALAARRAAVAAGGATGLLEGLTGERTVPQATVGETLAVVRDVVVPTLAKGVLIRRRWAVRLAEALDLDRRAVRRLQSLRRRYGRGPLLLRIPIRRQAVVLDPKHAQQVLDASPEPFATTTLEKRAALTHFEPGVVLISHGDARAQRRRLNEEVLDTHRRIHRMAAPFLSRLEEEGAQLLCSAPAWGLGWDEFSQAWFRLARRIVLGDSARNDHRVTDDLARLRRSGNWAFLAPKKKALRERFLGRLRDYLRQAEPDSLAALAFGYPAATVPEAQMAHWLFAFDAAGIAAFRTLALLASHPEELALAQAEAGRRSETPELPFLRACVLESLRLWPTTPAILRETTRPTECETGMLPAHTQVLIFVPYFHRDKERLADADRFAPETWERDRPRADWPLVPFSAGPAECPGKQLVLLLTTHMLAALLAEHHVHEQAGARLRTPLPGTLSHFDLRFHLRPLAPAPGEPRTAVPSHAL